MPLFPNQITHVVQAVKAGHEGPWVDVYVATSKRQANRLSLQLLSEHDKWPKQTKVKERIVRVIDARRSNMFEEIMEWNLSLVFMSEYLSKPMSYDKERERNKARKSVDFLKETKADLLKNVWYT